ncbi:MAG: cyclase family protein [Chloroflexi bacterium]|nr:cyclase family protein [Chloroflexota bacterium]
MARRPLPSQREVHSYLKERRNWGRWGPDDQAGAINLVSPQKRVAAAALVKTGRAVSLSRDFPKGPGPTNPFPAQHWVRWLPVGKGGASVDYLGIACHGFAATHIDALCHQWGEDGMWNGRDPAKELTGEGSRWGGIEQWRNGIITRGVFLDVPRHRGEPYVTQDRPIHGWELEDVLQRQRVVLQPGDALMVYGGREAWLAANPDWRPPTRPGLHASCMSFLRDHDVAVLVWDMHDLPFSVHPVIWAYGMAVIDNALLEPLARACAAEGRYEFMLLVAPLPIAGGTGSPVNPIAVF